MNQGQHPPSARGSSQAQLLQALASLGDPVRKRLFDLVRDAGQPMSRDQCVAELMLPKSTVRTQLDRLVEEGLLLVEFRKMGARTGPGSGRPTKLYTAAQHEVSASIPPRHYDLAAQILATAVQRSMESGAAVGDTLSAVAFDAGRELGAQAGSIAGVLERNGYAPEVDSEGGIIMANCPFHRLSEDHTGVVCLLNGALLNGALAGCGDQGSRIVPDENLSHCCARIVGS